MSLKISMSLSGHQHVVTLFRSMTPKLITEAGKAIRETTHNVERGARARVPVSAGGRSSRKATSRPGPGELRDTIRSEFTDDGLAGFVRAGYGKLKRTYVSKRSGKRRRAYGKSGGLGVYAMVVEYGAEDRPAKPYMRPSLEAERKPHLDRMQRAVDRAAAAANVSGAA